MLNFLFLLWLLDSCFSYRLEREGMLD